MCIMMNAGGYSDWFRRTWNKNLHPNGPARCFKYPDILWVSMSNDLTIVDARLNSTYVYGNTEKKPNCHCETSHYHDDEVK